MKLIFFLEQEKQDFLVTEIMEVEVIAETKKKKKKSNPNPLHLTFLMFAIQ